MNKGSRWSGEGKKKGRTSSKAPKTKYSFHMHKSFSLVFSLFWRDCNLVDPKRKQLVSTSFFFFLYLPTKHISQLFSLLFSSHLFPSSPKSFHPNIPLVSNQEKLEKSFECGTFGKRCLTRGISAIAIILNEKS